MSVKAIHGRDVILEFYKVDNYYPVACAENVSIHFTMETKSVKTIGDGANRRVRGKSKGYQVSFDGVIGYDTTNVTAWDLYEHYDQMTDVLFRFIFKDNDGGVIKVFTGQSLPTDINLTGPNDFAGQSMTLIGNGPPVLRNTLSECDAVISAVEYNSQTSSLITFMVTGISGAVRLEYTLDGGGRKTRWVTGSSGIAIITFAKYTQISAGDHTMVVYPVCESGEDGESKSINFTVS